MQQDGANHEHARYRFRPHERLRNRSDFQRTFGLKCSAGRPEMVVYVAPNELRWSRLGLSVSRRLGRAVRRNYVRRRIREAFRLHKAEMPTGLDIICIARPALLDKETDVAGILVQLVGRAHRKLARRQRSQPPTPPADHEKQKQPER